MRTERNSRTWALALLCIVLPALSGTVRGRTLYVDDDATPPGDGSSWTTAFRYLQDAIAATSAGDEIWVAQGVYRPDQAHQVVEGDRRATFLLNDGVAILGGFAGVGTADPDLRDPDRFATLLSGDLAGDDDTGDPLAWYNNSFSIVMAPAVGSDTVLDGLTICHAYVADGHGGGLRNDGGSPLLRHCTFRDNLASDGDAGVYNDKGSLRIEYCRFLRNSGEDSGALCNHQGSVEVIASEFIENDSEQSAAAAYNEEGDMVLFACLFRGNRGEDGRGSVWNLGDLRLLHCTFIENGGRGGAVTCTDGQAVIANCLFCRNTGEMAGALYVESTSVHLDQCTLYANVSTDGHAGAVYCRPAVSSSALTRPAGSFQALSCIVWANGARDELDGDELMTGYTHQIGGDPNGATLEYCGVQGWTPDRGGVGNIGIDPLFVAPDQNDFHLKSQAGHWDTVALAWVADDITSPCIDAGDPNSPLGQEPFPNGGRVNMGVYGGTCEASKSWFAVAPGAGIDAADLNGDGRVDAEDLRLAILRRSPMVAPE
ncbi:MAG: right-handed parallel beta-helix repeat-containing protein [Phycisphaerales bacterium]